ncbi:MAG: low-specificity L-threonine aldolase [Anaerolineae bacterium]|nr:MAG: low-specificity L-threonine aldolase [Anaerolineae bacterium]
MDWIDLRSDTVTEPTPEMRQAMAEAEVGDDVFGDDPTVQRLEELAAERMGKPAAVFVASGTMGNLAAVLSHCQRGDEIILGDQSHTYLNEAGGVSALGGVHPRSILDQPDGTLRVEDIQAAIRADDEHFPISRLIVIENTHNLMGGAALSPQYMASVSAIARERGLKIHLDGARIFNAAAALGVPASTLAESADSVTFCLSKGLCAPVGSVLCGSEDFIRRARRARKQLGGGMRQAGILAAAGIVALERMVDRLSEDHARARRLADGLLALPAITLEQDPPPSNMVYLKLDPKAGITTGDLIQALGKEGIKLIARDEYRMRLVVHYWIDDVAIDRVIDGFAQATLAS